MYKNGSADGLSMENTAKDLYICAFHSPCVIIIIDVYNVEMYCLHKLYNILSKQIVQYIVYTNCTIYCLHKLYNILSTQIVQYIVYTTCTVYCLHNLYNILSTQLVQYIVYITCTIYCLHNLYILSQMFILLTATCFLLRGSLKMAT